MILVCFVRAFLYKRKNACYLLITSVFQIVSCLTRTPNLFSISNLICSFLINYILFISSKWKSMYKIKQA